MIRAVAFDLDDTLYPEVEFVLGGYRAVSEAVMREHGFAIYDDLAMRFSSGARGDLFTPVLRARMGSVEESYVKQLVEIYRMHAPTIRPFPEVERILTELKRTRRLALISDGLLSVQERKLANLGIAKHFDEVVFPDRKGSEFRKPHAYAYLECARRMDIAPESLVYVGDNPAKDFVGARALKIRTVRVRRPGTLHAAVEPAPGYEADHEIASLEALPALLKAMEN